MTDPLPDANTRLAVQRTRLAHERTLMAWIRTCTSLIAFGFTIYQIFRYLSTSERLRAPLVSPQIVGVAMISHRTDRARVGLDTTSSRPASVASAVRSHAFLHRRLDCGTDRRRRPDRARR